MKITKEEVLNNLEKVKFYISEIENKKEEKVVGIAIKNRFSGDIIFQSTKTTYKEAIVEKGDADLSGANLSDADLSDANLCDANLRGADLSGADLSDADLSGADLSDADLSDADLSDADLCDADLSDANLCDANLCDAELQNAKFYGKSGQQILKRSQLPDFLAALGFIIEE